jgi:hypothetical protein
MARQCSQSSVCLHSARKCPPRDHTARLRGKFAASNSRDLTSTLSLPIMPRRRIAAKPGRDWSRPSTPGKCCRIEQSAPVRRLIVARNSGKAPCREFTRLRKEASEDRSLRPQRPYPKLSRPNSRARTHSQLRDWSKLFITCRTIIAGGCIGPAELHD